MQQLSNLDASFLSLESSRSPMHIGCILTFEAPATGEMTFERFSRHIESRLPSSPIFRRRLSRIPLDLDLPYWVEDKHFKLANHLRYVQLPSKNTAGHLETLVNHFFSQPLDASLPLWQIMFVEHADSSRFTALLKFHHAAVDGVSGEKILSGLLSPSAESTHPLQDNWQAEYPSVTLMLSNRLRSLSNSPKALAGFALRITESFKRSYSLRQRDQQQQPPSFFNSPSTPFNGLVEPTRQIRSARLPMAKLVAIKKACPGSTLNDVVLTVCSGALRQHLMQLGQLPSTPLVAMVPVSKRNGTESHQGNMISAMLVSLATQVDTPLERFHAVQQNALKAKEYNREIAMEKVIAGLPSWSSSWVIKAYTRLRLARILKPVFNLIITNVPGSRTPLYFDGAPLVGMEGMAPIVDGMGLTLVVTSYMDTLNIAVTSTETTAKAMPDLIRAMDQALEELYDSVMFTQVTNDKMAACA